MGGVVGSLAGKRNGEERRKEVPLHSRIRVSLMTKLESTSVSATAVPPANQSRITKRARGTINSLIEPRTTFSLEFATDLALWLSGDNSRLHH